MNRSPEEKFVHDMVNKFYPTTMKVRKLIKTEPEKLDELKKVQQGLDSSLELLTDFKKYLESKAA